MGLPWLDQPVRLHSGGRSSMCMLTEEQCAYKSGYWRSWYYADYHYAIPTVAFCLAFVGVFAVCNFVAARVNRTTGAKSTSYRRIIAVSRYCTYKRFHVAPLGWYTPPLGQLLMAGVGIIFFFSMTLGPKPYYWPNTPEVQYGDSPPIATRSGWMALGLLPFIFILAAKANLVTAVTGVSYEKLNVFHRWLSYAMFILALLHTFPFIVARIKDGTMMEMWKTSMQYWTGVAALIPQGWLTIMSFGPVRNRFYEFFKATHYLATIFFAFFLFIHCDFILTSWDYFIAAGACYLACLLFSLVRTHVAYGRRHRAHLSLLPGGVIEASIPIRALDVVRSAIPVGFNWTATQHVFVHFHGVARKAGKAGLLSGWSAHPFTICSLPSATDDEKVSKKSPTVRLLITPSARGANGLTHYLHRHLQHASQRLEHDEKDVLTSKSLSTVSVPVSLDGPYGGLPIKSFIKFDHVLIVAGGSGAGFTLPILEDLFRDIASGYFVPPKVQVVLATRSDEVRQWYAKEMDKIVAQYPKTGHDDWLQVTIHVTGSTELASQGINVLHHEGLGSDGTSSNDEKSTAFPTPISTPSLDTATPATLLGNITPAEADEKSSRSVFGLEEIQTVPGGISKSGCCSSKKEAAPVEETKPKSSCCSSNKKSEHQTVTAPPATKSCCRKAKSKTSVKIATNVGRPDLRNFVESTAAHRNVSLGIAVCGPGSMQYDVASAAAQAQLPVARGSESGAREVYLHSEHFSW